MTSQSRAEVPRLGAKVRALRRREGLNQVQLAERLGISPSYLNLIENNRRPLPAPLLIKLAQSFGVELHSFATDEDGRLVAGLLEAFSDPLFENHGLVAGDVRELAATNAGVARAILSLYQSYRDAKESAETLMTKLDGVETTGFDQSRLPSEEVSDLIQRHMNHFPELEKAAEDLWRKAKLDSDDLYTGLIRYLEKAHGIRVHIARGGAQRYALRRYDPESKTLTLSELLPTRSRKMQLAHQIGLLVQGDFLDKVVEGDPHLSTEESKSLARVALANYFAAAVLMPYAPFLQACREERYDLDVIGRRFGVGFEQACHRVTTLQRPGAEGVPFHMIRIDVAGNISKRFSASGIPFARFSGCCPRWNIFAAFSTPGMIRIQLSKMPDGVMYFCIARTVQMDSLGHHAQPRIHAIGLGCQVAFARQLVYADGVDLENTDTAVPVGVTCRLCERTDCEQRAFPSLRHPLRIDKNVRGVSLYAPVPK
jgi:predicted transcriptional regulator/DNA-binding XRE family transcriptional regulator